MENRESNMLKVTRCSLLPSLASREDSSPSMGHGLSTCCTPTRHAHAGSYFLLEAIMDAQHAQQLKQRRILFNDDGDRVGWLPSDYVEDGVYYHPEQVYDCVDQLLGTQVDTFVLCTHSATYENENLTLALDFRSRRSMWHYLTTVLGRHPHGALLDYAQHKGLEAIASIRMNDAHFAYSSTGPENTNCCEFWRANPHLRINPELDTRHSLRGTDRWPGALLDYAHEEVHQHILKIIREIFTMSNADGIELDFLRYPHFFKPEEVADKYGSMTELLRQIRRYLDSLGGQGDRPKVLGVLVPASFATGLQVGLDVASWIREGLIDYVVPKVYMEFVMDIPVAEFLAAARGTRTQVYAGIDLWPDGETVEQAIDSFRGAAAHYWEEGVDGLYLYNYYVLPSHPFTRQDRRILHEIGDPARIRRADKRYAFVPAASWAPDSESRQVPVALHDAHTLTLTIGDDVAAAQQEWSLESVRLTLTVTQVAVTSDTLALQLNGQAIQPTEIAPLSAEGVGSSITCDLVGQVLPRQGENAIRITVSPRDAGGMQPPILEKVELIIHYR